MKRLRPGTLLPLRPVSSFATRPLLRQRIQKPLYPRQIHSTPIRSYQQVVVDPVTEDVQLRKRFFTFRRFVLYTTYSLGTYFFFTLILGQLLEDEEWEGEAEEEAHEHQKDNNSEEEVDEFGNVVRVDDGESIFIPFQLPKKLPQEYYKNSDPEWQEFVKISTDHNRKNAIMRDLAMKVGHDVAAAPQLRMKLGKDLKVGRSWLDIKYPDSPPPSYARSGIEITDEYIAWSTQIIPHSYYVQLNHIIWPQALFAAFKNSLTLFYHLQSIKFKTAFGIQLTPLDKHVHKISTAERRLFELSVAQRQLEDALSSQRQQQQSDKQNPPGSSQPQQHPPSLPNPLSSTTTPPTGKTPWLSPSLPLLTPWSSSSPSPPSSTTSSPSSPSEPTNAHATPLIPIPVFPDLILASKVFVSALTHRWTASRLDTMPRGCFFVFGDVEVIGSAARAKIDVQAAYDPRTAKYAYVICKVKHVWDLSQSAKGGR